MKHITKYKLFESSENSEEEMLLDIKEIFLEASEDIGVYVTEPSLCKGDVELDIFASLDSAFHVKKEFRLSKNLIEVIERSADCAKTYGCKVGITIQYYTLAGGSEYDERATWNSSHSKMVTTVDIISLNKHINKKVQYINILYSKWLP